MLKYCSRNADLSATTAKQQGPQPLGKRCNQPNIVKLQYRNIQATLPSSITCHCKMNVQSTPRYQGKITSWKDEQGFGFITPNGNGPAVFVHIKSFSDRSSRPLAGNVVTYELTANEKGQPRAANVAFVRVGRSRQATARPGNKSVMTAAGFLLLMGVTVLAGKVPPLLFGAYICLSVMTYIAYAADKSAAQDGGRRTPENTLHMLSLAGGWPGALVAQQVHRHKTKKASFRQVFWLTVLVNCSALGWLFSHWGVAVLRLLRSWPAP